MLTVDFRPVSWLARGIHSQVKWPANQLQKKSHKPVKSIKKCACQIRKGAPSSTEGTVTQSLDQFPLHFLGDGRPRVVLLGWVQWRQAELRARLWDKHLIIRYMSGAGVMLGM